MSASGVVWLPWMRISVIRSAWAATDAMEVKATEETKITMGTVLYRRAVPYRVNRSVIAPSP
jgi:hypothetical protein